MSVFRTYVPLLFCLLVLWPTAYRAGALVAWFGGGMEAAQAYCINRQKPKSNCHGSCQLHKKLAAAEQTAPAGADKNQIPTFKLDYKELYESLDFPLLTHISMTQTAKSVPNWAYASVHGRADGGDLFHPPRWC